MCDSVVALRNATAGGSVLFGKSADCEVNEANAIVRIPAKKHVQGETVRITHLVIPQAEQTHEIFLTKAFWTYGCEVGVNEFGLSMGEEAVYTTEMAEEKTGVIGPDLMRLALERAHDCREAIDLMIQLLEKYGQGGSAELKGNSHFDSAYLMADPLEAYILETAGRKWAVKKIDDIGSISNRLSITTDWTRCSEEAGKEKLDWANTYAIAAMPPALGSPERQAITYQCLAEAKGKISARTLFDIMRQHGEGYHPATAGAHRNICVHIGPQENRWWQADGAMITEAGPHGVLVWVTGTSGNCVSIFKPVFLGMDLPEIGPIPTEHFDPRSLWWKHELLHRRAMADFDNLVPEIRADFDRLEDEFLRAAETVKKSSPAEKKEFMDHCFRRAMSATETWIARLQGCEDLHFSDGSYADMWQKVNAEAGLSGMPV